MREKKLKDKYTKQRSTATTFMPLKKARNATFGVKMRMKLIGGGYFYSVYRDD
jgi:hypothetical protein